MTISAGVQREIDRARQFGKRIEETVVNKGEYPNDNRNALLIAYWALIFDYHKAILALIPAELCGAAFALVRPVMEAVARAHVAVRGSEEDLRRIQEDEYRVNFNTIGPEIDRLFGLEHLMENFFNRARTALHSYAHSGLLQLGRRFQGTEVKPNYSDDEIAEVVLTTTSAAFMITNLVTKHFGFEDDWKKVTALYEEWGQRRAE
jgi:hypothetical protein